MHCLCLLDKCTIRTNFDFTCNKDTLKSQLQRHDLLVVACRFLPASTQTERFKVHSSFNSCSKSGDRKGLTERYHFAKATKSPTQERKCSPSWRSRRTSPFRFHLFRIRQFAPRNIPSEIGCSPTCRCQVWSCSSDMPLRKHLEEIHIDR